MNPQQAKRFIELVGIVNEFVDDYDYVTMAPKDASVFLFIEETSICMRGGVYHAPTGRFFYSRKSAIEFGFEDVVKASFVRFPARTAGFCGNAWVSGRHNGVCVTKYAKELLALCKLMWPTLSDTKPKAQQEEITFDEAIRFAERVIEIGALHDVAALGNNEGVASKSV